MIAVLSTSLPTAAAPSAVPHPDARLLRPASVAPVLLETIDPTPLDLRIGPHRFRIPRNYFRHSPHPSGVDTGFYLRALLPGMEPITEANRHVFRMPPSTEEGRRVLGLLFEVIPDRPRDDARWRTGNVLRSRAMRGQAASLDDFAPVTDATHGLRSLRGPPIGSSGWFERDLYWGELPAGEGRFVGVPCDAGWEDRPGCCHLWVDWRGRTLSVSHERQPLPRWREIAAASRSLMDRLAVENEANTVGR